MELLDESLLRFEFRFSSGNFLGTASGTQPLNDLLQRGNLGFGFVVLRLQAAGIELGQ